MNRLRPYPPSLALLLAVFVHFCLQPLAGAPERKTSTETRLVLSWEYDDNVFEDHSGKVDGGSGSTSLFSRLRLSYPASITQIDYQLGYKAHHRLSDADSLTAGDVLVQRIVADSERRISPGWTAGAGGEVKLRNIYRKNELNLLSEEGYVRGSGRLYARTAAGNLGRLTLSYRYSFCNFETFHNFDYSSHSPALQLSRRLAANLVGTAGYSYARRGYERLINIPDGSGGLAQVDRQQRDNFHQFELNAAWSRGLLLSFSWALQRNLSNNYGFSYWNNRFSLLFTDRLPLGFFLNAYLFFEIKRYSDRVAQPILVEIITEENDNNGAILKLSRDITKSLEASLTASLYRNESSIRELNFHKSLVNFGLTCRF